MDLEEIMLSEISWSKKDTSCVNVRPLELSNS